MCWASEIDVTTGPLSSFRLRSSLPDQASYVTGEVYAGTVKHEAVRLRVECAAVTEPGCVSRRDALTAFEDQARFSS
jgi:hypothetical protein